MAVLLKERSIVASKTTCIKALLFASLLAGLCSEAFADGAIVLDQIGDSNYIRVEQVPLELEVYQDGLMNRSDIANSDTAASNFISQYGNSNTLNIEQDGFANSLVSLQDGDSNAAVVYQIGEFNHVDISQHGSANEINSKQIGNENYLSVSQVGNQNQGQYEMHGSGNSISRNVIGDGGKESVIIRGNNQNISISDNF